MGKNISYHDFLPMITDDLKKNKKLLKKYIDSEKYNNLFLFLLHSLNWGPKNLNNKIFLLETLLDSGVDPNLSREKYFYPNFLFLAIKSLGLSGKYFSILLDLAIKYKINLNEIDGENKTIFHYILQNNSIHWYVSEISYFEKFIDNGYDIFVTDKNYNNLKDFYIINCNPMDVEKDSFIKLYNEKRNELYSKKYNEIINELPRDDKGNILDKIDNKNLLVYLCEKYYDEEIILDVIGHLLRNGINPNIIVDHDNQNFIYHMLNYNHSNSFIYKVIKLSIIYGLDVNNQNCFGSTILHNYLIKKQEIEIIPIYELLLKNGFNHNIQNKYKSTIEDLVVNSSDVIDKEEFIKKYSYQYYEEYTKDKELSELGEVKYYKTISNHSYLPNYCYNFSLDSFCVILGSDCSLKSATLNNVSDIYVAFNVGKKAFMTSADILIKNCLSVGGIREKLILLFDKCIENNYALFIDDFDKLYNIDNSIQYKKQLDIILSHYIKNEKLKLAITLNSKNKDFVTSPILKDSVHYLELKDLNNDKLLLFLDDYIVSQEEKRNIKINENIINILKQLLLIICKENNIKDKENITNVKIVIKIINKIIEYKNDIDINNLIYSIKINEYIKDEIKEIIIKELNDLNNNYSEENVKKLVKKIN